MLTEQYLSGSWGSHRSRSLCARPCFPRFQSYPFLLTAPQEAVGAAHGAWSWGGSAARPGASLQHLELLRFPPRYQESGCSI